MTQCASSPQDFATDERGLTRKLIRFIRLIRGHWFSMTLGQIDERVVTHHRISRLPLYCSTTSVLVQ